MRGDVAIRDVNRALDVPLEGTATTSTVAGLCIDLAGGVIPQRGARLAANDGIVLTVVAASARTVRRVRVTPGPLAPPREEDDGAAAS